MKGDKETILGRKELEELRGMCAHLTLGSKGILLSQVNVDQC
jgi:hypothetical protein